MQLSDEWQLRVFGPWLSHRSQNFSIVVGHHFKLCQTTEANAADASSVEPSSIRPLRLLSRARNPSSPLSQPVSSEKKLLLSSKRLP
jgi:hypothetical protein